MINLYQKINSKKGASSFRYFDDLWALDLQTCKWRRIGPSEPRDPHWPIQRYGHASVVYNKKLYIFGGYSILSELNSMYEFDCLKEKWSKLKQRGQIPTARSMMGGVVWEKGFYIFGGDDGIYRNDCFRFDFETHDWKLLKCSGLYPSARYDHCTVVHLGAMYVLFGGNGEDGYTSDYIYRLDLKSLVWERLRIPLVFPDQMYGCSAVVYHDVLYIFGGCADLTTDLNFFCCFNFKTNSWKFIDVNFKPSVRSYCGAVVWRDNLILQGGTVGGTCLDQIWCYRFESIPFLNPKNSKLYDVLFDFL